MSSLLARSNVWDYIKFNGNLTKSSKNCSYIVNIYIFRAIFQCIWASGPILPCVLLRSVALSCIVNVLDPSVAMRALWSLTIKTKAWYFRLMIIKLFICIISHIYDISEKKIDVNISFHTPLLILLDDCRLLLLFQINISNEVKSILSLPSEQRTPDQVQTVRIFSIMKEI